MCSCFEASCLLHFPKIDIEFDYLSSFLTNDYLDVWRDRCLSVYKCLGASNIVYNKILSLKFLMNFVSLLFIYKTIIQLFSSHFVCWKDDCNNISSYLFSSIKMKLILFRSLIWLLFLFSLFPNTLNNMFLMSSTSHFIYFLIVILFVHMWGWLL